jgi:hypothetical protein
MANNKTAIASIASLSLGQDAISDFSSTSSEPMAKKIWGIFDQVVEELQANDWFFNRYIEPRRITSSSDGEPDYGRYDYGYAIPSECVFIRGICDRYNEDVRYRYERRGRYIVTDQTSPIYLLYNERLTTSNGEPDIANMPVYFHRLISARIAYILAPNVAENQRIRGKIEIEWSRAYTSAREKNGEDAYVAGEQGNNDWRDGASQIDLYL